MKFRGTEAHTNFPIGGYEAELAARDKVIAHSCSRQGLPVAIADACFIAPFAPGKSVLPHGVTVRDKPVHIMRAAGGPRGIDSIPAQDEPQREESCSRNRHQQCLPRWGLPRAT